MEGSILRSAALEANALRKIYNVSHMIVDKARCCQEALNIDLHLNLARRCDTTYSASQTTIRISILGTRNVSVGRKLTMWPRSRRGLDCYFPPLHQQTQQCSRNQTRRILAPCENNHSLPNHRPSYSALSNKGRSSPYHSQ